MRPLLVLLLAAALGGCALFRDVIQPEVQLTSVGFQPGSGARQQLEIGVRVTNPNNFALKLADLNYRILLQGKEVARGNYRDKLEVAARGSAEFAVPVELNLLSGLALIQSLLQSPEEKLNYRLEMGADVTTWGVGRMQLNRSGTIQALPPDAGDRK